MSDDTKCSAGMSGPTMFRRGQLLLCRKETGLWQQWQPGICTDAFIAPVSGEIVYVVNGTGYYERDVVLADDEPASVPEPQSLRA